tara:strand:+ start:585 stop:1913 length:1329 start_codon:yes stop_codon:yes gene_type:complete
MKFQDFLNNISAENIQGVSERKFSTGSLSIDQSTALINEETFSYFENYAEKHNFTQKFQDLMSGVRLNNTENRAVTHFKYRDPESDLYSKNFDEMEVLAKLIKTNFNKIIIFGIGGSYLGPKLMHDVFSNNEIQINFVTGSDPAEFEKFKNLDLSEYGLVIASKSFSTLETLGSYEEITKNKYLNNTFAVTASRQVAIDYGIHSNNILGFDPGAGGRFSIWTGINIGFFLSNGRTAFEKFLLGANSVDILSSKKPGLNPALSLAIQDIVFSNLLNFDTTLILNYDYKLRNFYAYAQQLEMESLGKSVDRDTNELLDFNTGSIIWGGYGPQAQHSFFQHLFQGNRETNIYFIASKNDDLNFKQFKGQTKSLRDGTIEESDPHKKVLPKRYTTILLKSLSPESLGELIAIWENKTIFMSMFWNINPFDQWGVELGKLNTKKEIE